MWRIAQQHQPIQYRIFFSYLKIQVAVLFRFCKRVRLRSPPRGPDKPPKSEAMSETSEISYFLDFSDWWDFSDLGGHPGGQIALKRMQSIKSITFQI